MKSQRGLPELYRSVCLILMGFVLSCAPPRGSETAKGREEKPRETVVFDDDTWKAALLEHRADKDEEFMTSATSPMAGVRYLRSAPLEEVFVIRRDDGFDLEASGEAGAILHFELREDRWHWQELERGEVSCRIDEEVIPTGSALGGQALFEIDRFRLLFYPGEDRVTLIVFDPERPEKQAFEHLLYYPIDQAFAVDAHLRRLPDPEEVVMLTSRNLEKTFHRYASIRFEIEGIEQNLSAFKYALSGEGSDQLFIPFRDSTSGSETYGSGRFLELEEPAHEQFILDFNRAFNPLCNYSPAYNCAIPPRENHLRVAIRAGELSYPH